jgi:hypothetical protein
LLPREMKQLTCEGSAKAFVKPVAGLQHPIGGTPSCRLCRQL